MRAWGKHSDWVNFGELEKQLLCYFPVFRLLENEKT
jgi:hypothetical protein